MQIAELRTRIDNFKTSDEARPNDVVSPVNFLVEYVHTSARMARKPLKAQAMYVEGDPIGQLFQGGFNQALARRVAVSENIDAYVQMITNGVANKVIRREGSSNPHYATMVTKEEMFADFVTRGGDLVFTNQPRGAVRLLPQVGRNHMKFYFGDENGQDFVFAGKVNISEGDFADRPDFLVKFTDPRVVKALEQLFYQSRQGFLRSGSIQCNEQTTIHVDQGRLLNSPVQARMIEKIRSSKDTIEGVEPFIPDIRNLLALNGAKRRGVHVDIVSSMPAAIYDRVLAKTNQLNQALFDRLGERDYLSLYPGWIHAATRVFDRRSVIFTTHNLSFWGYVVGTAEWAIETTNPEIVQQCVAFIDKTRNQARAY